GSSGGKFSRGGGRGGGARAEQGGVAIRVSDTGIGIPAEAHTFIFESFRQVDSSPTRPYSGSGLGLYIVKRFLELLGGTIGVESEVGRGSTFRVWLPTVRGGGPPPSARGLVGLGWGWGWVLSYDPPL